MIARTIRRGGQACSLGSDRLRNAVLKDKPAMIEVSYTISGGQSPKQIIRRYVARSRVWSNVTPVILPGYDDFKSAVSRYDKQPTKAERLL